MGVLGQVAVTGASGFLALHIISLLLQLGYGVRGTLRNLKKSKEIYTALSKYTEVQHLSFVYGDLLTDVGWDTAFQNCQYVLHVASPLPLIEPRDHSELIIPARDGTRRVLKAAVSAGVKRVVLTSSVAAIGYGHKNKSVFTEEDWSVVGSDIGAYNSSKTIAEQAAWDFYNCLGSECSMELVSINPGLVIGPLIHPDGSASIEVVRKLLAREVPGLPRIGFSLVDVRDVAFAHVSAMTNKHAIGKRYICATGFKKLADLARLLDRELGPRGYPVVTTEFPNWLVRLIAQFHRPLKRIVPELGKVKDYDSSLIRKEFKWRPRSLEESIMATAESLIELDIL